MRFGLCLSAGHCSEISCITHVIDRVREERWPSSTSPAPLLSIPLFFSLTHSLTQTDRQGSPLSLLSSLQRSEQISRWCLGPSDWRSVWRWRERRRWLRPTDSTRVYTRFVWHQRSVLSQNKQSKNRKENVQDFKETCPWEPKDIPALFHSTVYHKFA